MTRHAELTTRGWTKMTTYDEPRLSEMVAMYEELGFEVRVEPFEPASSADCAECMRQQPQRFRTIYTRRPRG